MYVEAISDDPRRFQPGSELTSEDGTVRVIEAVRSHGQKLLVKFEDIHSRDAADLIRGPLYVSAAEARSLEDGEYWDHQLVGCEVIAGAGGKSSGRVRDVIHTAAQDLLVVDTDAGERMVPLVKEIVVSVDVEARTIVVDAARGLLD